MNQLNLCVWMLVLFRTKTILEHVLNVLSIEHIAILVKPQFECMDHKP